MNKPRIDAKREKRIEEEIVVDACDEWERAMGWFYYLERTLHFPFRAVCAKEKKQSPLRVGEKVVVIGMPPEEVCAREMYVQVSWNGRTLAVPLAQLRAVGTDAKTKEALADWDYWVKQGHEF